MNARPSRRERPAKPALTRAGIIGTAVAIMRAEGLQKVTMRRLAAELDTGPASLYVYVANTDELHAAVLGELLGEVDLDSDAQHWREQLVDVLMSYVRVLISNPQLARSAVTVRPNGPNYLALIDRILGLLGSGGVPPLQAAFGVDLLLLTATAHAAEHAEVSPATHQEWERLTETLDTVDADRYPHVHALSDVLLTGSPESRLGWSFRALIDGLQHTTVSQPKITKNNEDDHDADRS